MMLAAWKRASCGSTVRLRLHVIWAPLENARLVPERRHAADRGAQSLTIVEHLPAFGARRGTPPELCERAFAENNRYSGGALRFPLRYWFVELTLT